MINLLEKQLNCDKEKLFHPRHPFPHFHANAKIEDILGNAPTILELKALCAERASRHGNVRSEYDPRGQLYPSAPDSVLESFRGGAAERIEALYGQE